ncbi:response regulator [Butyrivibrio sp. VCD2006]|uniref:response regulator n=1 Tax=Butyrivibrio sp. VCD2006 TaxID=1280664 RepID=UPI0006871ED1|nr:response regulator [Butyrivibrio sp. VCD2006]
MSRNILLIDDSAAERLYLSELIKKIEDVDVDVADGADEAMEKLLSKKYDLIFIDYYMPTLSGTELLEEILSQNPGGNAETKAVVLGSAADFRGDFLKVSSFINYLEKPVEFNMLKAAISMYA